MKTFLLISGLALGVTLAHADLIDEVYSPPGGFSYIAAGAGAGIGTGEPIPTGQGETYSFSSFNVDPNQYSALYWGPVEVDNVDSVGGPANPGQMTFAGFDGSYYVFNSTTPWTIDTLQHGLQFLPTRMLLQVSGAAPAGTEADLDATTAPPYPLFQVTGNFSATFVFQVDDNGVWTGTSQFVNEYNTFNAMDNTSVDFHFFADPVQTPEPASIALILAGLGGIVAARKRRVV